MHRFTSYRLGIAACLFVSLYAVDVAAQPVEGFCERTPIIRDEILERINVLIVTPATCQTVTDAQLLLVTNLNLSHEGITSLGEDDFSGLTNLESLNLKNNTDLPTPTAQHFSDLSNLTFLDLISTNLSSPPADLFQSLSRLEELRLSSNGITSPPANLFHGLFELRELDLFGNPLTTLPANLFNGLRSLETLNLNTTSFSDPPENLFAGLSNLKYLHLSNNNSLTSLPAKFFNGLTSLEKIYLNHVPLTTLPADLFEGLSSLRILDLYYMKLAHLHENLFDGLTSMDELYLFENQITDLHENLFDGLSGGVSIYLYNNPIDCFPPKILGHRDSGKIAIHFNTLELLPCAVPPPEVELVLTPNVISEADESAKITASLSFALSAPTTIDISVEPDPPATMDDYVLGDHTTLTIPADQTMSTETVMITTVDNDIDEAQDKTLTVSGVASNPQGVTQPENKKLTIRDDDDNSQVTLSVSPFSVNEDIGSVDITVTAKMDVARNTDREMTIAIEDDTALKGIDYNEVLPFDLTIPAFEMMKEHTFTLMPIMDNMDEPPETIEVRWTVDNRQINGGWITITDADPVPLVSLDLDPMIISETEESTRVTASLSPPLKRANDHHNICHSTLFCHNRGLQLWS